MRVYNVTRTIIIGVDAIFIGFHRSDIHIHTYIYIFKYVYRTSAVFADCVKALIIVIIIIVIIVVIIIIIFHAGLCLLCNKPYTRTRIKSEQVRTEPVITGLLPKYRGVGNWTARRRASREGREKEEDVVV